MKKFLSILSCVLLFSSVTLAQTDGFGVGIILGEPTGISVKKFIGGNEAIDGAVAWSFRDEAAVHVHADYLFHDYSLINVRSGRLPVYYGIGARIKLQDDAKVGVRIPVGVAYEFGGSPIDIFLELVPLLDLVPDTDFDFNGALGVRIYLN